MPKTNAERQADYRNRRATTPKNSHDFARALLAAYQLGRLDGEKNDWLQGNVAAIAERAATSIGESIQRGVIHAPELYKGNEADHLITVLHALSASYKS